MPLSRQQIKDRIDVISRRQSKLEKLVKGLQDSFFEEVLRNYDFIISSPKAYGQFFGQFNKDFHAPILRQLLEDLRFVIEDNGKYFMDESDVQGAEQKIKAVEESLAVEFGISQTGTVANEGYLADIITDTSVKRNFRAGLVKFGTQGQKLTPYRKKLLQRFIKGDEGSYGIWESFYAKEDKAGGSIFDVYQKADRLAQNTFATELGMQAKMYVGGLMASSRDFCEQRNGKIFLDSEIQAWAKLEFQGKPKVGYVPEIDLGGYRCRHHLSALSNATAMRLDPTIKQDSKGVLYRAI
jgi:hypothetical protein